MFGIKRNKRDKAANRAIVNESKRNNKYLKAYGSDRYILCSKTDLKTSDGLHKSLWICHDDSSLWTVSGSAFVRYCGAVESNNTNGIIFAE